MFENILVVCTGNICRSPIAERLLRKHFPQKKKLTQQGSGAFAGHAADSEAIFVAQENDLSPLDTYKGKQFNSEIARKYDLILVMDKGHIEQISKTVPEARGKTMLLGYWLGDKENRLIHIGKVRRLSRDSRIQTN